MRPLAGLLLLSIGSAFAQNELVGKDQFPEFRTFSGLPGCVTGVDEAGRLGMFGAMGISTPVAHSVGARSFAFGLGNTSLRGGYRFPKDRNGLADGGAWAMMGVGTNAGNLTVGGMVLSTKRDNVLNLHFTPKTTWDNLQIGVGVQDAFSTGGSSGEAIDLAQGGGNSRSLYAVATVKLLEGAYASVGTGTRRFQGVFGNVSANICRYAKAVAEYDTFNWNYGIAADLVTQKVGERTVTASLFVGQIRGKYNTWAITLRF